VRASDQDIALDAWLRQLGFIYDPALGRVRNPFEFLYAEDDAALRESFVQTLSPSVDRLLRAEHTAVVGYAGSGKTALSLILAQNIREQGEASLFLYQGAHAFAANLFRFTERSLAPQALPAHGGVHLILDVSDGDLVDNSTRMIETLLHRLFVGSQKDSATGGGALLGQSIGAPGPVCKLFLPRRIEPLLEDYVKPSRIHWSASALEEFLANRISWASQGRRQRLAQICDPLCLANRSPDRALVEMALTPRRVLERGQCLLLLHIRRADGSLLLNAEDWRLLTAGKGKGVRPSRPVEVKPIPAEQPALRLHLQHEGQTLRITRLGRTRDQEEEYEEQTLPFSATQLPVVLKALLYNNCAGYRNAGHSPTFTEKERQELRRLGFIESERVVADAERMVGVGLHRLLIRGEIKGALETIWSCIALDRPVPLHLYFSPHDTLLPCYPWELLRDRKGRFLVKREGGYALSLIRHIIYDEPPPSVGDSPPSVLYIAPRPEGQNGFPRAEWECIPADRRVQSASDEIRTFRVLESWLSSKRGAFNVLHFDGHGLVGRRCPRCAEVASQKSLSCQCGEDISRVEPCGYLFFEREDGTSDPISCEHFRDAVAGKGVLVALLSTCQSAAMSGRSMFNSLAPGLLLDRVPAVVGMQLPVPVEEAREFVAAFYEALIGRGSVVQAVTAGRRRLSRTSWWYIPALYLREQDDEGYLFEPS